MKKTTLILVISMFALLQTNAQQINYVDTNWKVVVQMAKSSGKYIFIDAYTEWCGWCKVMDKKTFTDSKVIELMNGKFIPLKMDMETGFGIDMARKFGVSGFPTFLIFNSEGRLVYRVTGFQEAPDFLASLSASMDPAIEGQYKGISSEIHLDFPQFYKDAFGGKKVSKYPTADKVDDYLKTQDDLTSEINWRVMSRFTTSDNINKRFFELIDIYRSLYGDEVDEKINDIIHLKISAAKKNNDASGIQEASQMIDTYYKGDKETMKRHMMLEFYSATKKWGEFAHEFENYLAISQYNDLSTVNSYCWQLYEDCDDKDLISKSCTWMQEVTNRDPQYMYLDTYAALLYKARNKEEAIKVAKTAIETGKKNKEDVKSTEELLLQMEGQPAKK